jgi:hypothetical protein
MEKTALPIMTGYTTVAWVIEVNGKKNTKFLSSNLGLYQDNEGEKSEQLDQDSD